MYDNAQRSLGTVADVGSEEMCGKVRVRIDRALDSRWYDQKQLRRLRAKRGAPKEVWVEFGKDNGQPVDLSLEKFGDAIRYVLPGDEVPGRSWEGVWVLAAGNLVFAADPKADTSVVGQRMILTESPRAGKGG